MAFGKKDNKGIYKFGEDDTATDHSSLLNKLGDSVSDSLRSFSGTPQLRAQLTPPEGSLWVDTDTAGRMFRFRNGSWQELNQSAGMSFSGSVGNSLQASPGTIPSVSDLMNGGSGVLSVIRAGVYDLTWTVGFGAATTGRTFLAVSGHRMPVAVGEDRATLTLAGLPLSAGAQLSFLVFQTTGATRTVSSDLYVTRR